ncbi:MAG: hypothetical protein L3J92_04905 [Thermoplasmata archaeon]|nr:hypothetical protein [Thermoplasmata archaeon]
MKQLVRFGSHAALWVLAIVVLASVLGAFVGVAAATSPTYTLTGIAELPSGAPVPLGVQVDLVSKATGAMCTTSITGTGSLSGGQFKFNSTGPNACSSLQPGYWGVYVPDQTNLTLKACSPFSCAVLPQNTTPVYYYQNASQLTIQSYAIVVPNVNVVPYNATLYGNVTSSGSKEQGATVSLLDATYNQITLVNNTTNVNGSYSLKVPFGTWVLQTVYNGVPTTYNYTQVNITSRTPASVNPKLNSYVVSGRVRVASSGAPVPTAGNVTLIDPTNHLIYSAGTAGGYYAIGTYPAGFVAGTQTFDVILAESGYGTTWYYLGANGPVTHNVLVNPVTPSQLGVYTTAINFTQVNITTGTGNVSVVSSVNLGNNSVVPGLPNATVSNLWAQLGLDYSGNVNYSTANNAALAAWLASNGPTFPATQAGLSINGTTLLAPAVTPTIANFTNSCVASCGPSTPSATGSISYGWHAEYPINGTIPLNSSAYSVSFGFAHPTSSADVYNYTVTLPAGYVLSAGTSAPARATLTPRGPDGTWTSFTLSSLPSASPSGTATFAIVKANNLEANVSASVKNFAFSSANVLNSTHGNYTVIVGVGQNVTFSTLNSTYPAGTNGTRFVWNFGDGSQAVTKTIPTTNHTYATVSGNTPYAGTVNITSSGGQVNSTTFKVWVAQKGGVTAAIKGNWTQVFSTPAPYARINWSASIQLNATGSTAAISPTATVANVISVASWTITAKGYKVTKNITASSSGTVAVPGNWTPSFLGAGNYYTKTAQVGGSPVVLTGWEYNVSLTVWSGTGQSATTTFNVLVNDTEAPSPAFVLQNSAGKSISGSGLQVGKNDSVKVVLNAGNSTDPHNGSLMRYYWLITNPGNTSVHLGSNTSMVKPNATLPSTWLNPQQKPYVVNLTVWDLNGNHAFTNQTLTISPNTTYRPILASNNLTAPTTFTAGTSYTLWVNVTVGGGSSAVANNVTVRFYLLSPSGTGSQSNIGGSPGSVTFYSYAGGAVNSTLGNGLLASLAYNKTVRAEIHWTPSSSGNFVLYANASASNEYAGDYINGPQTVQQSVTVNPNPTTQALIYGGIAAAAIVALVLIYVFVVRPRGKGRSSKSSGRSGQDRKGKDSKDKSKDDADEDDDA